MPRDVALYTPEELRAKIEVNLPSSFTVTTPGGSEVKFNRQYLYDPSTGVAKITYRSDHGVEVYALADLWSEFDGTALMETVRSTAEKEYSRIRSGPLQVQARPARPDLTLNPDTSATV